MRVWVLGFAHAVVAGAVNSVSAMIAAPDNFNLSSLGGVKHVGIMAATGAFIGAVLYLKQSPLPADVPSGK